MSDLPDAIEELRSRRQWVVWRYETRDGKETKVPYCPLTGQMARSNAPETWVDYLAAVSAEGYNGIGFVVTRDDSYVGIDIDSCLSPAGEIARWAWEIIRELDSYTEVTPSGTGLRVWIKGKLPPGGRKGKPEAAEAVGGDHGPAVELYESGRYFTWTGRAVGGLPASIEERQEALCRLHASLFPAVDEPAAAPPRPRPTGPAALSDDVILAAAARARNGAEIMRLYHGTWKGSKYGSQSEADQALCCHLAFYTKDALQLDRLFCNSGLWREKWDKPHYADGRTYGAVTIEKALQQVTEQYQPPAPKPPPLTDEEAPPAGRDRAPEEAWAEVPPDDPEPDGPEMPGEEAAEAAAPAQGNGRRVRCLKPRVLSSPDFMAIKVPERKWAIHPYLPEGLAIFAGKPKSRKSFAALGEAVAIATPGGRVFGRPVETGDVLLLALEDNEESMQDRLGQMLQGAPPPKRLYLSLEWPRLNEGGLQEIESWLKSHPEARLVVIDVLNKVRPRQRTSNGNPYDHDYDVCDPLIELANRYRVCIQVLHHLRKMISDDPLDLVLGSIGMTGAPDTVWVWRGQRGQPRVTLYGTGRRIKQEFNRALLWNHETVSFSDLGDAEDVSDTETHQEILAVLELGPRTPKQVYEMVGGEYPTICNRLRRMEEKGLVSSHGGRYSRTLL
jgi:putative DNA primase/helicase